MNPLRRLLLLLFVLAGATLAPAATYRTNLYQMSPPPGCFEPPNELYTITNPANTGQIWDIVIRTHHWVEGSGWAGGYYTNPTPTGEVVRLMPGDSAILWKARGYQTVGGTQIVGINWIESHITNVSLVPTSAPTITWTNTPGTVASGQGYTVAARGHDADGNLAQVNIWKDGQPFAFAGGGNGTYGNSSNPTSDIGPRNVTFTAQAVDATGARSPVISHVVTISAPVNQAPTIAWTNTPGTVANGQWYTVSARGHDADGNLTQVNVWKDGQPFAFAGGGNGTDGDSGNPTSDIGPRTVTFTAQAVDATGAVSATITQTVTVNAPVNQPPTVALLSPGSQTVAAGTTLSIRARATDPDGNLTGHNLDIQRPAGDWNFQGGFATGEPYQGGPVGSSADSVRSANFTFTDIGTYHVRSGAYDGSGWYHSATASIIVVPANHAPTITWTGTPGTVASGQGYTVSARGHDDDGNLAQVNVWKNGQPFAFAGGGNGTDGDSGNPTSDPGPRTVTFTAQAVDAAGATSATITQTVTIMAPPPVQYTLTTVADPGGSVSTGGTYTTGSTAYVTATPDAAHEFSGWTGNASGSANPLALMMDRDRTVRAQFALRSYAVTTQVSPTGSGTVSGGGAYNHGDTATLAATAAAGWRFDRWSGDATGSSTPQSLLVNSTKTVTAHFARLTHTLTVSTEGSGTVTGAGTYSHGETATVTASPAAGWRFGGFTGDLTGSTPSGTVVMNGDRTVTAHFVRNTFALVTQAESGGTVSPGGTYPEGTTVTVTATPDSQHDFAGWTGDAGGTNPSIGVLIDGPKTVRARFALKQFTLTTTASTGGSVTPGGTYPIGSVVTVTANADANSRFLGWTGDANGTASSIAVTMTGPKSVKARFATKTAQTISFAAPADTSTERADLTLTASASSGLPVSYVVLSGPATLNGNQLSLTGPGPVTIRAEQGGNGEFLAAPPVTRAFNVVAPAIVKYAASSRTLLQAGESDGQAPIVLERP